MLEILVHEAEVQVDGGDVGVVLSTCNLQNVQSSVHVLECLAKVSTSVMV